MTTVWVTIGALAVLTAAIKVVAPLWLGGRPLPPRMTALIVLLAPALLAALVVIETFTDDEGDFVLDERLPGVLAGAAVMAWRRNLVWTIVVAATITALVRAAT